MSYVMQRLEGHVIECEGRNGELSVYVNGRCVNGGRRLSFALGVVLGVLLMCISGCSDRPEQTVDKQPEPIQKPVEVRPRPIYMTSTAWYYCDKDTGYIKISRAPIIDGQVQKISHARVCLDWMDECDRLAVEWDKELDNRERWND